jgi:hypothetical protein
VPQQGRGEQRTDPGGAVLVQRGDGGEGHGGCSLIQASQPVVIPAEPARKSGSRRVDQRSGSAADPSRAGRINQ